MIEIENKLVFETDTAKWYTNSFTESLQDYLHNDSQGKAYHGNEIVFSDYYVYMVETDEYGKEYVVVDNSTKEPMYANSSFEGICVWVDMIRFNKRM
jgi:hypothetical protein